jgi:predicted DNA-binding transcriptional regulator YafY
MLKCSRSSFVLLAQVDRHLSRHRGLSVCRLAAELEVSTRTVQRYLDFLRVRLGLPITYDPKTHRWRYPCGGPRVFTEWVHDYAR